MRLTVPPVYEEIEDEENPFHVDSFFRSDFAENLTRVFRQCDDGLVVTIDAEWGSGKTTLLKLWEQSLKNDPDNVFVPIYYDAFRNDFSGDVFLSIAVKIHEALKSTLEKEGYDPDNSAKLKHLKKATLKVAGTMLKMTTGAAASALTANVISHDMAGKAAEKLSGALFDTLEHDLEAKFNAHSDSMKLIEDYQKQLKSIVSMPDKPKKVVFFVDELDRCRPDFSVQVIEKIKHLFNIDGVYFVLAANCKQLINIIKNSYGISDADAMVYLEKFINFETKLVPTNEKLDAELLNAHLRRLLVNSELDRIYGVTDKAYAAIVDLLLILDLTPRAIEKVIAYVTLVSIYNDLADFSDDYLMIIFLASVAKVKKLKMYEQFKGNIVRGVVRTIDEQVCRWGERNLKRTQYYKEAPQNNSFQLRGLVLIYECLELYNLD